MEWIKSYIIVVFVEVSVHEQVWRCRTQGCGIDKDEVVLEHE